MEFLRFPCKSPYSRQGQQQQGRGGVRGHASPPLIFLHDKRKKGKQRAKRLKEKLSKGCYQSQNVTFTRAFRMLPLLC